MAVEFFWNSLIIFIRILVEIFVANTLDDFGILQNLILILVGNVAGADHRTLIRIPADS
jgi:hypothetical protein